MAKTYATVEKNTKRIIRIYDERDLAEYIKTKMGDRYQVIEIDRCLR